MNEFENLNQPNTEEENSQPLAEEIENTDIESADFEYAESESKETDDNVSNEINTEEKEQESVAEPQYHNYTYEESSDEFEPIKYSKIKKEPIGNGVKVFALVMVVIILMTACCTVGYILGSRIETTKTSDSLFADTRLDLEDKPDNEDALTTAEVYDVVNKSVVGITVYNEKGEGSVATGVVYTEDGYIITNDHIYANVAGAKFKIKTYDGNLYDAVFVAGDTRSDLAVLKIDGSGFYPATFGNSEQIVVGESVVAIGRPNGISENSITRGIVSLKERRVSINTSYSMRVIQTDTPINPGNSGGALVNMYGQVVGITSSKLGGDEYEGIGFAIPTTVTKSIVESLIKYGYVNNRCRLGISYKEINAITKEINDYPVTGVLVAAVNEDSDLYGKINEGDIITAVNGVEISSDEVILEAIENSKPGDALEFTIYKTDGSTKVVSGKLLADVGSSSYQSELTLPKQ